MYVTHGNTALTILVVTITYNPIPVSRSACSDSWTPCCRDDRSGTPWSVSWCACSDSYAFCSGRCSGTRQPVERCACRDSYACCSDRRNGTRQRMPPGKPPERHPPLRRHPPLPLPQPPSKPSLRSPRRPQNRLRQCSRATRRWRLLLGFP